MAEHIQAINELKQLPEDTHIFCPRRGPDDTAKYDSEPPLPEEAEKLQETKLRSEKFFSALPLLAYDGPECLPYHDWIYHRLDEELERCELCIRNYYVGKIRFKAQLLQDYEEDEVQQFLSLISRRDIQRIQDGLNNATKTLEALPESSRGPGKLETKELFALFEALHCEPFFNDEELLKTSFDRPFKLVQTRKELKVAEILPAITKFLFSTDGYRLNWAVKTWNRLVRVPTDTEWDWAIRDTLVAQLQLVNNDQGLIRYWSGMKVIINKLDKNQIRHKLFDLTSNFAKLALDHLAKQTFAIPQIVGSLETIFERDSDSFWQAMVSVSATTVAEQIFASPHFGRCLQNQVGPNNTDGCLDVLSWITPFLNGLPAANRPAACHTLAYQLFKRIRSVESSTEVKQLCFDWAVSAINQTVSSFVGEDTTRKSTSRLVLCDALATVGDYINELLKYQSIENEEKKIRVHQKVLDVVRNTLSLECQCLKTDFEALTSEEPKAQSSSFSQPIWRAVLDNLNPEDVGLSAAAIKGTMSLPGLEQFRLKSDSKLVKEKESFNRTFNQITGQVSEILEHLSEFPSIHLDHLFATQDICMALMANLFSPDQATYQAAVDLIKNISGASGRKEALTHLLDAFLSPILYSICWVFRRVANMASFASVPRLLRTGAEILDILCDATGILRTKPLHERDVTAIQSYWAYQWMFLASVFRRTEKWSIELHDKALMTDVCRDTMQYAQELFKQYYLFLNILRKDKSPDESAKIPQMLLNMDDKSSNGSPPKALDVMVKWLRLRDPYLAETLSKLIIDMLSRLKEYGTVIAADAYSLTFVQDVATVSESRKGPKTILTANQKAELVRALENYTGKQIARRIEKPKKQQRLDQWTEAGAQKSGTSTPMSVSVDLDYDFDDEDIADEDLRVLYSKEVARQKPIVSEQDRTKAQHLSKSLSGRSGPRAPSLKDLQARQSLNSKAFVEKRKQEEAARKARDRELASKLRGKLASEQTANAGSGLEGLGVKGKDHSVGQSGLMVSSESESDSDSEDDSELFGGKVAKLSSAGVAHEAKIARGPVRKIKQIRSAKDMRARLAPDLTDLHKTILGWDFFAESDTPPNSDKDDYTLVTNTFKTVTDYQKTFEPLLVLEGWQSFRSAREDGNFKPFEVKVANSLIVDNFFEVNTQVSMAEGKELGLGTSDVVLLSKSRTPHTSPEEPHCLARVKEITRKRGEMQITYRVNAASNPLRPYLNDKATVYGVSILSLTPLEREYGALMALPYYDLCEEVIRAKPSPLLNYRDSEVEDFRSIYKLNLAQATAVKSAVDNDAFTLVQGPPGSGKTKTICAIVGAIMTSFVNKPLGSSARLAAHGRPAPPPSTKKLLVCAPSNAAVDELVMRFKDGIKLMNGLQEKINVVRLGRSDAINAAVKDVTLEELVNAKLSETLPSNGNVKEDIYGLMQEHKGASDEYNELKNQMSATRAAGGQVSAKDEQLADALRRKKVALGARIDDAREKQNSASRDADVNRKRVQQEVLDSSHVLCATLSGSGHEIFQGLNVEFETVIIDEAAQSIELSALIPLKYGCSKCILVGDPKQLPPTVLSRQAAKYQYEQSLFARMEGNHQRDVHLLDTQYRMHPEISLFPSKTFYDSRLQDGPNMARLRARPWHHSAIFAPYRFFDVEGMSESSTKGHSLINKAEIKVAMQLYDRLITDVPKYDFYGKVGIITPYKGQLKELKRQFVYRYGETITSSIEFNTTDAFQGRESEIIIFSCVRASTKGIGFLNDVRRMNVGLTRAKCSLWVLGNSQALLQGEFWRALVTDAKSRNLYTDDDIPNLLRRPLLTEDMMKEDVIMTEADSPEPSEREHSSVDQKSKNASEPNSRHNTPAGDTKEGQTSSGRSTLVSRPASISRKSSSTSTNTEQQKRPTEVSGENRNTANRIGEANFQSARSHLAWSEGSERKTSLPKEHPQSKQPSGGKPGLNPNSNCSICGSDAHFSHNCDNQRAKKEQGGLCDRCQQPGHLRAFCQEPRCLQCGEIGHAQQHCSVPLQQRLSEAEKAQVQEQEAEFRKSCGRAREKRAERQLGEHGRKIPIVKSTPYSDTANEGKRKRDDVDQNGPPKAIRTDIGAAPVPIRPPGATNNGTSDRKGPPPGQPGMIRKKKARDEDMFTKRR